MHFPRSAEAWAARPLPIFRALKQAWCSQHARAHSLPQVRAFGQNRPHTHPAPFTIVQAWRFAAWCSPQPRVQFAAPAPQVRAFGQNRALREIANLVLIMVSHASSRACVCFATIGGVFCSKEGAILHPRLKVCACLQMQQKFAASRERALTLRCCWPPSSSNLSPGQPHGD